MSGTPPLGMTEFFALEAGEYLERLDALLAGEGAPAAEEFVRLARALRGSALMASQPGISRAASGLESLARAVREGRRGWNTDLRQTAIRAVDDLKTLVRRVAHWTDEDTRRAETIAGGLEQLAGRPSAQVRAVEALGLDAGARAFIAREGAAIASALDRAAHALRANPGAREPLHLVRKALEPLRGLAALNDLPPLGDLLDGVEQAIGEIPRAGPLGADLFAAGASAIARAAREVAERGRPDPDAETFRAFAGLLVRVLNAEADVVPIETLFLADGGPHLLRRGTPPARAATLGRLELVSHGEHLRQAADSLERAPSATQRELRAHALAATFRSLTGAGGSPLADAVAAFAVAARDAVLHGVPVSRPGDFGAALRRAGDLLSAAAASDEQSLAQRLAQVAEAMAAAAAPAVPAVPQVPPAPPAPPAPSPPPAPAAPEAAAAAPPIPEPRASGARPSAPRREPLPETPDFVGSWVRYERLKADIVPSATLDELVGAAGPGDGQGAAATHAASRAVLEPPAAAEPPIVDIETLLYRGARAAARARELRHEARGAPPERLRDLIEEVCDLVALAQDSVR